MLILREIDQDMESSGKKNFIYLLTLAGFLLIFWGLDKLGLHYQPEKHRLNQKKIDSKEVVHTAESHDEESTHLYADETNAELIKNEEEEVDPYFTDNMKSIYVAFVFLLSGFFTVRTFRNKPSA